MQSQTSTSSSSEESSFDLESLVFFQLEQWLQAKGPCLQNYEELLSVAPRRGQLQSKVWRKRETGDLVVLKTFDRLNLKTIQRAILNEIVVPFVVDSEHVLKPSEFFIEDKVLQIICSINLVDFLPGIPLPRRSRSSSSSEQGPCTSKQKNERVNSPGLFLNDCGGGPGSP